MIALLAPSKTMDFDSEIISPQHVRKPLFKDKTDELVNQLKRLNVQEVMTLMKVNQKIAQQNHDRFQNFSSGSLIENQRAAILALTGDTYKGLDALSFNQEDLLTAENCLRILSGLYGILSPLTLIEPYRLEMGLKMQINDYQVVSSFWKEPVTEELNRLLPYKKEKSIINLASAEYLAAVDKKRLNGNIIDIIFRENRDGKLKTIAIFAKKARGMMARYIVKKQIKSPDCLKSFKSDGYTFDQTLSDNNRFVFVR